MKKNRVPERSVQETAMDCIQQIKSLDFNVLDISDYNRTYINRLLPHLSYFFKLYAQTVDSCPNLVAGQSWIVDFGGGHGFLSLFLKLLGFNVIYCDHNLLSVHTITLIKEKLGFGPDYIVGGSSAGLSDFCTKNGVIPTHLIATDLIEHVYDLPVFFRDLKRLNPRFEMVFTTGSNARNFYKCRKLHQFIVQEEKEYLIQRRNFIRNQPEIYFSEAEIENLAQLTRGKIYSDIRKVIDTYHKNRILPSPPTGFYNTCDPETGNWTERIISFKAYKRLASEAGFQIVFTPGFYNEERSHKAVTQLFRMLNFFIKHTGNLGFCLAPYIVIRLSGDFSTL
jgi:2-polyprenyl-3-methyl-5-hydroxy-6-metoxy-1,4-benzoquinol methylase